MGAYLQRPRTDIDVDSGGGEFFEYASATMQGWRINQEDAHTCLPDFNENPAMSLFGVFDGHGGPEVARYCAEELPQFIKSSDLFKEGHYEEALRKEFLNFDSLLKQEHIKDRLWELSDRERPMEDEAPEDFNDLLKEAVMPLEEVIAKYQKSRLTGEGTSGTSVPISSRSQTAGCSTATSEFLYTNKEVASGDVLSNISDESDVLLEHQIPEIVKFENQTKFDQNNTEASVVSSKNLQSNEVPPPVDNADNREANIALSDLQPNVSSDPEKVPKDNLQRFDNQENKSQKYENQDKETEKVDVGNIVQANEEPLPADETVKSSEDTIEISTTSHEDSTGDVVEIESDGIENGEQPTIPCFTLSDESTSKLSTNSNSDNDSVIEIKSKKGKVTMTRDNPIQPRESERLKARNVLASHNASGKHPCRNRPSSSSSSCSESESTTDEEDGDADSEQDEYDDDDSSSDENEDSDSVQFDSEDSTYDDYEYNGVEEPGEDSGSTAVVALLTENKVTIANIGDSRAILGRITEDGNLLVLDLSIDHKPELPEERSRIESAGGRVDSEGRINGGLNLSRAFGDHSNKKREDLPAEKQKISAFPDIHVENLNCTHGYDKAGDKFLLIACDGIWNQLTTEEAGAFVWERITGGMSLESILQQLFYHCLAADNSGDGSGCDNMTAILLHFQRNVTHEQMKNTDADAYHADAKETGPQECESKDLKLSEAKILPIESDESCDGESPSKKSKFD